MAFASRTETGRLKAEKENKKAGDHMQPFCELSRLQLVHNAALALLRIENSK